MKQSFSQPLRHAHYKRAINRTYFPPLAYGLPWSSIMLASIMPLFVVASAAPIVPPLGYLMFLAWRFVRPGLLPVWSGALLGAFDDMFSGQPFGSAILLWSATMLAFDALERRFPWHGFFQDWLSASLAATGYLFVAAIVSGGTPTVHMVPGIGVQFLLSAMLFPIMARMVSVLDRFRLIRIWGVR